VLKLKALAFIHCAQGHIAMTDEGRRALENLLVSLQPFADVIETKAERKIAAAYPDQDGIESAARVKVIQPCDSRRPRAMGRREQRIVSFIVAVARSGKGPPPLFVAAQGDEIVVTASDRFGAATFSADTIRDLNWREARTPPIMKMLARALQAATDKARELGWFSQTWFPQKPA
jgi:hypothetical protein